MATVPTADDPIRVLLVDDEEPLRALFRRYLERGGCTIVGEAEGLDGLLELSVASDPHVVLLDLRLGPDDGATAIGPLCRALPTTMIAALSSLDAIEAEAGVRAAGAFAYYEKSSLDQLPTYLQEDLTTFRRALAGEDVIAPSAISRR